MSAHRRRVPVFDEEAVWAKSASKRSRGRSVGSCRRKRLDSVIPLNEQHLRRLGRDYLADHHEDRTHIGLKKGTPGQCPIGCVRPIPGRKGPDRRRGPALREFILPSGVGLLRWVFRMTDPSPPWSVVNRSKEPNDRGSRETSQSTYAMQSICSSCPARRNPVAPKYERAGFGLVVKNVL